MSEVTVFLGTAITVLIIANIMVSLFPRKSKEREVESLGVKVAFIPPIPMTTTSSGVEAKLEGHIQSTNQKIGQLFFRIEALEKRLGTVKKTVEEKGDETWIETVPIRNKKLKSKRK